MQATQLPFTKVDPSLLLVESGIISLHTHLQNATFRNQCWHCQHSTNVTVLTETLWKKFLIIPCL